MTRSELAQWCVSVTEEIPEIGSTVSTEVHSIGGRMEIVTGPVVDYRRNSVVVQTEAHGRIVVPLSKIIGEA